MLMSPQVHTAKVIGPEPAGGMGRIGDLQWRANRSSAVVSLQF